MHGTTRLRELLNGSDIIVAPGAFDGLSARLIEAAGFYAVYASGGAIARSIGVPDLGLLGVSEVVARLEQIVAAVSVPVIADADTGYGNALNTQRAVQAFARAGVAGLHLEDQTFPKRCGHYDDKAVIPTAEFTQKLRAAREALSDPDFVLIARTDAIAVEGFDAAIARAEAYLAAGADVIFVEAPQTEAQIAEVARRLPQPKLINMFPGGNTPMVPLSELKALGYRIVIVPGDTQRAAIKAMQEVLAAIRRDGDSRVVADRLVSFGEREAAVDTPGYLARDRRYQA